MSRVSRWLFAPLVGLLLAGAAGCDSLLLPGPPEGVGDGSLKIVRVAPDAPPLAAAEVSFWIVKGEAREVQIRYQGDGYLGECLRLVIPANAPLRRPDGTLLEVGDSVFATVRVSDPSLFLFEMLPEGLTFDPADPARLEIHYRWLAEDTNGDGVVDAADTRLADGFSVWSRNGETGRWSAVPSVRAGDSELIQAPVTVFTRYALASD